MAKTELRLRFMLIKPIFSLCVRVKVIENDRTKVNIFIPLPIIAVYILIDSLIDILELLHIIRISVVRYKGKKYSPKQCIAILEPLKILIYEAMLHLGRYDFVTVEAGDKQDKVYVLVGTR